MSNTHRIERSLKDLIEAARRIERAAEHAERGAVENEGFAKGAVVAAQLVRKRSVRLDERHDASKISSQEYKAVKKELTELQTELKKHAEDYFENAKHVQGRAAGLRFALDLVHKLGEEEHASLEANKKSPDVNEKVNGAEKMREHLRKSREAALQAKTNGVDGDTTSDADSRDSKASAESAPKISETQVNTYAAKRTLAELKDEAADKGVPVSGTKSEVARRILTSKAKTKAMNGTAAPNGA